jgi:hypothetical protein
MKKLLVLAMMATLLMAGARTNNFFMLFSYTSMIV